MAGTSEGGEGPVDVPETAASLGVVYFASAAARLDVRLNGLGDSLGLAFPVRLLKISARVTEAVADRGGATLVFLKNGHLHVHLTISRRGTEIHHFTGHVWAEAVGLTGIKGGQGYGSQQSLEGDERHGLSRAGTRRTAGWGWAGLGHTAVGDGHVWRLWSPLRGRVKRPGTRPGTHTLLNHTLGSGDRLPTSPWPATASLAPEVERSAPARC